MSGILEILKQQLLAAQKYLNSLMPAPYPPSPDSQNPDALFADWSIKENARHNVRAICDQEELTEQQKNDLSKTVHCESNYEISIVHPNIVNGIVTSTDYGIAQINDYWHIGLGKDFPSSQYVLENPEACIRWMARQWKAGNAKAWVCYLKGMYENYSS